MAQKTTSEASPELRRKSIEADVEAYLAAGNKIEEVPSGISSQDPQGRGKQLRLGPPKEEKGANEFADSMVALCAEHGINATKVN